MVWMGVGLDWSGRALREPHTTMYHVLHVVARPYSPGVRILWGSMPLDTFFSTVLPRVSNGVNLESCIYAEEPDLEV